MTLSEAATYWSKEAARLSDENTQLTCAASEIPLSRKSRQSSSKPSSKRKGKLMAHKDELAEWLRTAVPPKEPFRLNAHKNVVNPEAYFARLRRELADEKIMRRGTLAEVQVLKNLLEKTITTTIEEEL